MTARAVIVALFSLAGAATPLHPQSPAASSADPFVFLQPAIHFSDDERRKLDDREIMIRILPADGHELAAMAVASLDAGPDALMRSIRNIVDLKRSPLIPQLGRFSRTPRLEDLRALTLEDVDVAEIRGCQPDHCELKLAPDEIRRLQRAMPAARTDSSKVQIEQELHRILLERAQGYLHHGAEDSATQFSTLLQHSPYVEAHVPALASYLERYPAARLEAAESFLYWSKEMYAGKPMMTITHVTVLRGRAAAEPEVLVASRDIFSTRYTSGSLTLTLLFRGTDGTSRHYLVYINRTWIDGVRALWRPLVEHRIKKLARAAFADVRARIERNRGET